MTRLKGVWIDARAGIKFRCGAFGTFFWRWYPLANRSGEDKCKCSAYLPLRMNSPLFRLGACWISLARDHHRNAPPGYGVFLDGERCSPARAIF